MTLPNWSAALEDAAAPVLDAWAASYGLDPALVYALVALESGFNPNAYRAEPRLTPPDASYGLTQILYGTARGLGYGGTPQGLFDPDTNVAFGLQYLADMVDQFGTLDEAISAYNEGPGSAAVHVIHNPSYVAAVRERMAYFAAKFAGEDVPSTSGGNASPLVVLLGAGVALGLGAAVIRAASGRGA